MNLLVAQMANEEGLLSFLSKESDLRIFPGILQEIIVMPILSQNMSFASVSIVPIQVTEDPVRWGQAHCPRLTGMSVTWMGTTDPEAKDMSPLRIGAIIYCKKVNNRTQV